MLSQIETCRTEAPEGLLRGESAAYGSYAGIIQIRCTGRDASPLSAGVRQLPSYAVVNSAIIAELGPIATGLKKDAAGLRQVRKPASPQAR